MSCFINFKIPRLFQLSYMSLFWPELEFLPKQSLRLNTCCLKFYYFNETKAFPGPAQNCLKEDLQRSSRPPNWVSTHFGQVIPGLVKFVSVMPWLSHCWFGESDSFYLFYLIWEVADSNFIDCSIWYWDPVSLLWYWWASGQINENAVLTIKWWMRLAPY